MESCKELFTKEIIDIVILNADAVDAMEAYVPFGARTGETITARELGYTSVESLIAQHQMAVISSYRETDNDSDLEEMDTTATVKSTTKVALAGVLYNNVVTAVCPTERPNLDASRPIGGVVLRYLDDTCALIRAPFDCRGIALEHNVGGANPQTTITLTIPNVCGVQMIVL